LYFAVLLVVFLKTGDVLAAITFEFPLEVLCRAFIVNRRSDFLCGINAYFFGRIFLPKRSCMLPNTNESLRENSTLPCNDLHGKEPYMHGKAFAVRRHRTAVWSTATVSLSCASRMLHGKGFAVRLVRCRALFALLCNLPLPCAAPLCREH
jgi:hypothetical protein